MPETEDDIQITNKSFIGSGGFCEYYYQDGKLAIGPEINIGFVHDGEFIGINSQELKFYKYKYQDKKFVSELLTQEEIQKLYPEYKIIKVSEFKNNEITINKKFFEKINVLLLNDTEQLKYSMLKYSSLQTGTLKLGMLWIGGYLNLPQLITDYHDRHPLVTCHLDVEGSKTLFHILKARDLHAIFIIGSEKQLLNQSV